MHARPHRRHARGAEGACRLPGWHPGERAELARASRRSEGPRPRRRARDRGRRRGARLLEGPRRGLAHHPARAVLASQDSQHPQQGAEIRPARDESRSARGPRRADTGRRCGGDRHLRPEIRGEIPRAVECLTKDREALLAFFDFPAEHWDHLRTANPIESVFATVRHRTVRTKGALSPTTARLMVFKLVMAAAKTWRRLTGENQLPKVMAGVTFQDGTEVIVRPDQRAA